MKIMFSSRAEIETLKDMVKSLARSVEDVTTEIKILRNEVEELRKKI